MLVSFIYSFYALSFITPVQQSKLGNELVYDHILVVSV